MPPGHLSPVEQEIDAASVLLQVRQLVDSAVTRSSTRGVTPLPTVAALREATRALLSNATKSVRCMVATSHFAKVVGSIGETRHGIPVSVLAAAEADLARHAPGLCAQPGLQLRIVPSPGRDLLIVDDHRVLSGPSQEGGRAMMSDCPHTSDVVRSLFQERWSEGVSLADHERLTRIAERPLTAQVVALLAEGLKDDAASARLGVSVRTFRRHVADLLRELGIRSRFQLGVRARNVGLLPPDPDTGTR